ncbi:hypothetical protein R1flu_022770 [Riccia fluitans]|uniref:Uncharacterized protein n=1 Tax=Riccia fluitans TaxID=41844 RepID=A0ABD1XQ48_9MARC
MAAVVEAEDHGAEEECGQGHGRSKVAYQRTVSEEEPDREREACYCCTALVVQNLAYIDYVSENNSRCRISKEEDLSSFELTTAKERNVK